jgi:hypothetical protein
MSHVRRFGHVAAILVAALISLQAAAAAQDTSGTLRGVVSDPQGLPIPAVTVILNGPQGMKTTTTDGGGRFTIPFLTPAEYDVRAEMQGFKAFEQSKVAVGLGQSVDVAIKLEVGGVAETVNITAGAPELDMRSTAIGASISSELVQIVPVGRRLADTLYLAPGVSSSDAVGRMNPSISGGSGLDNLYIIDGVNVTSAGYGGLGSFSTIFRSLGNATPFDFIKDIQVKTGGYDAEYGESIGGVVNVVTKSGSNDLRGSLFAYTRPQGLESSWTKVQTPNGTVQTLGSRTSDGGAEGGGPIVRNHLFFFGAIDPSREVQTFQAPQGFPLLSLGGVDRVRDAVSYSAKATFQLNDRHRVDASFFGDPSKGLDGPQRPSSLLVQTTSQFSALSYGGHSQTVRYQGVVSSSWLLEASYGRALNDFTETPDANTWQYRDMTVTPNVRSGGIGGYEPGNHGVNNQYAIKSTHVFRGHEIKYGVQSDRADWNQLQAYTGPTFTAPNGQQTASGAIIRILSDPALGKIYRVSNAFFGSGAATTQSYQNAFVQDSWRIGTRVTINPGIRVEHQTINGNTISDWSLGANWAPRIGGVVDATGDGRTKVFASWGRFYARVPNDLAARVLSGETIVTTADYFDAGLTRPIPNGTLAGGTSNHFTTVGGAAGDSVDPNARMPYLNEVIVGVEREILPRTSISLRYTYRDVGRIVEDEANCPVVAYFLPQTGAICGNVSFVLTNPSSQTPINPAAIAAFPAFANVSFADPARRYHAVDVTLTRRLADNWSATASYRWSQLRGNYEGFFRDDNGQSDPGMSTLYDFPQNDPTFTAIGAQAGFQGDIRNLGDPNGILPLDRPNQFKVFGNYMVRQLNLGVGLYGSSGAPLTMLAAHPIPGYTGGEIPVGPRGSGIQTVDGFMTRTPFTTQVDFQAAYNVKIDARRRLTVMADIFNLFDQHAVLNYDTFASLAFGSPANPNFGQPTSSVQNVAGPQIQAPRQVRLGVRFSF